MIKSEYLNSMYGIFLDKNVLTTKELLSIGFTNRDLTRLKEKGILSSSERGFYEINDSSVYLSYLKNLVADGKYDNVSNIINNNIDILDFSENDLLELFDISISVHNYDFASKCIFRMREFSYFDNKLLNSWAFLLSFLIKDSPFSEVKNTKIDNILLSDNYIFDDKVRWAIFKGDFRIISSLYPAHDEQLTPSELISKKLVGKVFGHMLWKMNVYDNLIDDGSYETIVRLLEEDKKVRPFCLYEKYLYCLTKEYMSMCNDSKLPVAKGLSSFDFNEAIIKRRYSLAREIYIYNLYNRYKMTDPYIVFDNGIRKMLEKVVIKERELQLDNTVKKIGDEDFSLIFNKLMVSDIDGAILLLDQYLADINKSNCRNYIISLIKLSLLDNDALFTEPMIALSKIRKSDYQFTSAVYIQDFFLSLDSGDLKKAKVFLDIISYSKELGGAEVAIDDLRKSLEMKKLALSEDDLEVIYPKLKPVVLTEEELPIKDEVEEEKLLSLADVIANVRENDNIAMLAPMSDEDTSKVLALIDGINDVDAFVITSARGEDKHVVLKFCGRVSNYINIGETLRMANFAYNNEQYNDAINLYEDVLPVIKNPKPYLYAKLGFAYYRSAENTDFSDAIDYLSLADFLSERDGMGRKNGSLIEKLKIRSGYNGIRIDINDNFSCEKNVNKTKYKKQ